MRPKSLNAYSGISWDTTFLGHGDPNYLQTRCALVWLVSANLYLGDGATQTATTYNHVGLTSHIFPAPGVYTVTASVLGPTGPSHWTQSVIVDPPLVAAVTQSGSALSVTSTGGAGSLIAAHWTFDDSSTADGLDVVRPATATSGVVTVVDAAGNRIAVTF